MENNALLKFSFLSPIFKVWSDVKVSKLTIAASVFGNEIIRKLDLAFKKPIEISENSATFKLEFTKGENLKSLANF